MSGELMTFWQSVQFLVVGLLVVMLTLSLLAGLLTLSGMIFKGIDAHVAAKAGALAAGTAKERVSESASDKISEKVTGKDSTGAPEKTAAEPSMQAESPEKAVPAGAGTLSRGAASAAADSSLAQEDDVAVVIAAAVAAMVRGPHRVVSIRQAPAADSGSWSREGRREHYASHRLK